MVKNQIMIFHKLYRYLIHIQVKIKKNSYKIIFKIKLVEYINSIQNDNIKKKGKFYLRNLYNIPKSTLNDWFKNYNSFKNETNNNIKRLYTWRTYSLFAGSRYRYKHTF